MSISNRKWHPHVFTLEQSMVKHQTLTSISLWYLPFGFLMSLLFYRQQCRPKCSLYWPDFHHKPEKVASISLSHIHVSVDSGRISTHTHDAGRRSSPRQDDRWSSARRCHRLVFVYSPRNGGFPPRAISEEFRVRTEFVQANLPYPNGDQRQLG